MRRTDNTDAAPCVVPLAIPAGAIVFAPPPVLVGEANASHVGMDAAQLRGVLAGMARETTFAACVILLSRRPKAYAAAPADVLRYLRSRHTAPSPAVQVAAANDGAEVADDAEAEAERLLSEVGARPRRAAR